MSPTPPKSDLEAPNHRSKAAHDTTPSPASTSRFPQLDRTSHVEENSSYALSDLPEARSENPTVSRPLTHVSSTTTLCHLSDDEDEIHTGRRKTEDPIDLPPTIHETPSAAMAAITPKHVRDDPPPPIPAPDLVAYLDPASAGGGGPLKRISTLQRERAEAEARERAERAHREALGLPIVPVSEGYSSGGILNRFRSGSTASKRKPRFVTPLVHHEEETTSRSSIGFRPTLTPTWSSNTLADAESVKGDRDLSRAPESGPPSEQYVYPDGGYGWIVVICCMVLAGATMGQGMNYGAYQSYYTKVAFPHASSAYIGVVGTMNAFFMNFAAFFFGRLGDRYGYKRILYISVFVAWLGMFIASWCSELWLLLLFQGIMNGLGCGMAMPLFMSLPSQWFYRRRGLASGLALSGAGLGGGTSILIVRELLQVVGYKRTLLIISFVNAIACLTAVFFIRTRPASPEASGGGRGPWMDTSVVKSSGFWSISISLVVSTIGYGAPWVYLQQWVALELPSVDPTLAAFFCLALGRAMIGAVADVIGPLNTYALVFALSGVIQLSLWLTAKSFAHVCIFAVVYGLIATGFLGLIPQIVVQLFGASNLASNVGLLILFNGPGNLAGSPISGAVYDASGRSTFKWVIIINGSLQLCGGLIAFWARFKASRNLLARV